MFTNILRFLLLFSNLQQEISVYQSAFSMQHVKKARMCRVEMFLKPLLLAILVFATETLQFNPYAFDIQDVPDYVEYHQKPSKNVENIRKNFIERIDHKRKVEEFDTLVSRNTMYADNISHFEIEDPPKWQKAFRMEEDFKNLLMMKTVKYVYKRGDHWRTWREIKDKNGSESVICYKCQSIVHPNCTECSGRGVWVIEDGAIPCPYEILSLIDNNNVCAAKITGLNKEFGSCPFIVKSSDLTTTCDNPIVTRWRFSRNYKIPGRFSSVICNGREYCEVLTLYQIFPDQIIFRVVQSDRVIYSRIMKNDKKNYACVGDCGIIDLATYKVTRPKENGTVYNLMKKKRNSQKKQIKIIIKPKEYNINLDRKVLRRKLKFKTGVQGFYVEDHTIEHTTKQCKSLICTDEDSDMNYYDNNSYEDLAVKDMENAI